MFPLSDVLKMSCLHIWHTTLKIPCEHVDFARTGLAYTEDA